MPNAPKGGQLTALEPGFVARVAAGLRYAVTGVTPGDFFGPQQPLPPEAQQAAGRQFDYPVGYNIRIRPREEEGQLGFRELRGLADSYDLLRLVIETRKDQIERLRWNIKPRDIEGQTKTKDDTPDPRCAMIEQFFRKPDQLNSWGTWLRMLVEDLLVIDAPCLYRRKTMGGAPFSFDIMDGSLIKRVIDEQGRTPAPPSAAYQQILKGLPAVDYTTADLIYMPRNPRSNRIYGYSPVEQIVMTVNIALRKQVSTLAYYTEGNTPEALVGVPPEWTPDQIGQFQQYWDSLLAGDLGARRHTRFVPGGLEYHPTKDVTLKDDFDEWLARVVCFAFSISPTAFTKQVNRATAETQKASADEEGLAPLQLWVKTLIDLILVEDFNSPDLEFTWFDDTQADPLVLMQVNTGYVAAGVKTRNEVRGELGLDPIPDGDEVTITAGNTVQRLADALDPPDPPPQMMMPGEHPNAQAPQGEPGKAGPGGPQAPEKTIKRAARPKVRQIPRDREATRKTTLAISSALTTFFGTQKYKAADAVCSRYHAAEKRDLDVDWDQMFQPLNEALSGMAQDGGAEALLQVGVTDDRITDLVNQDAVDYAKTRAAAMIGKRLNGDGRLVDNPDAEMTISDSTRDMLQSTVAKATAEGWSTDRLRDEILQHNAFSKARADTIARTETAMADVGGNMAAYRRSGVVTGKRWILGSGHAAEDECNDNADAGVIPLDELFPTGDDAPPQHPNCICDVIPVTDNNQG